MIVGIQMIRMEDFQETAAAADNGDEKAREFILTFLHWNKHFEDSDERPLCFSCAAVINRIDDLDDDDPGNMGGFGFAKLSKPGAEETEGFGCPFCSACQLKGHDKLCDQFAKMMEKELGVVAITVH